MKKASFTKLKRYLILICFTCFFIFLGQALFRAYSITPEKHLMIALNSVNTDGVKALTHFKLATQTKNEELKKMAYLSMARLYHHGAPRILKNIPKAVSYYEKANTFPEAQYLLALFYDAGDKVPENRAKAVAYMKQAARTYPPAQYALAVWMERGYLGKVQMQEIVGLYTKAAEHGILNAMKSLISIYLGGYSGFPQNLKMANYWKSELKKKAKR